MSNATKKRMIAKGVSPLELVRYSVVACADGKEQGFYTELHINSPDEGIFTPVKYQAIADKSSQGIRLSECALREATNFLANDKDSRRWVSFHLPSRGIEYKHLSRMLKSENVNAKCDMSRLVVEVSGDVLYEDAEKIAETMTQMKREYGVRFMISGFCDEYCPVLRISKFPFNFVMLDYTIDTSKELRDVAGAVKLAKGIGATVIAVTTNPLPGLEQDSMPDMIVSDIPEREGGDA